MSKTNVPPDVLVLKQDVPLIISDPLEYLLRAITDAIWAQDGLNAAALIDPKQVLGTDYIQPKEPLEIIRMAQRAAKNPAFNGPR